MRILHVDDSGIDAELVRRLAARLGPELAVEHARDGEIALARLEVARVARCLPDLMLLDLNMPRLDGHGCLRAVRANPAFDALAVVVLTTSMRASDREAAARAGAAGYLVKPLTREVLGALVAELSGRRAPGSADAA